MCSAALNISSKFSRIVTIAVEVLSDFSYPVPGTGYEKFSVSHSDLFRVAQRSFAMQVFGFPLLMMFTSGAVRD